jgi:hypothetical protein
MAGSDFKNVPTAKTEIGVFVESKISNIECAIASSPAA